MRLIIIIQRKITDPEQLPDQKMGLIFDTSGKKSFVYLTRNKSVMKRKLIIAAFFLLIASTFTACEGLFQNCKMCATNTYENGTLVIQGSEVEYCGSDLITKEAVPDIPVGAQIIKVECH
jgi:hypothetical protein